MTKTEREIAGAVRIMDEVNAAAKAMSDAIDGRSVGVVFMALLLLIESAIRYYDESAGEEHPAPSPPAEIVKLRVACRDALVMAVRGRLAIAREDRAHQQVH